MKTATHLPLSAIHRDTSTHLNANIVENNRRIAWIPTYSERWRIHPPSLSWRWTHQGLMVVECSRHYQENCQKHGFCLNYHRDCVQPSVRAKCVKDNKSWGLDVNSCLYRFCFAPSDTNDDRINPSDARKKLETYTGPSVIWARSYYPSCSNHIATRMPSKHLWYAIPSYACFHSGKFSLIRCVFIRHLSQYVLNFITICNNNIVSLIILCYH